MCQQNPFQAPEAAETGVRLTAYNVPRQAMLFGVAGLISGACSGASVVFQPWGLVAPGLIFAVALIIATRMVAKVSFRVLILVPCSAATYFMSGLTAVGISNRLITVGSADWIAGFVGGLIGSAILTSAYVLLVGSSQPRHMILRTMVIGAVVGAVVSGVGVWISNAPSLGHPLDDIFRFMVWQTAVAFSIGYSKTGPA